MTRVPSIPVFKALTSLGVIALCGCVLPSAELPSPLDAVSQPGEIQREDTPERTTDGLVRVRISNEKAAVLYLMPPGPVLERFDRLMLRPPEIRYARGVKGWNAEDEAELKIFILEQLDQQLFESGRWKRSPYPGDGVLLVQLAALDLDVDTSPLPTGSNYAFRSGGGALLVLDVRESVSNNALLRFGQRRPLRAGEFTGWDIDRERFEEAFRAFALEVGQRLPEFEEAAAKMRRATNATPRR